MAATIRTSRADQNWLSYTEDQIWYYLGTDSPAQIFDTPPTEMVPVQPGSWDAILKISHNAAPIRLSNLKVAQGRENSLDINHECHDVQIGAAFGCTGGVADQVITIKGGSTKIVLVGTINSQGRNGDVILGNWSDQSYAPSGDIDLTKLRRLDGQPLRVVVGRVNNPIRAALGRPTDIRLPPGAQVLFWRSIGLQSYWWAKRAYVWAVWAFHVKG